MYQMTTAYGFKLLQLAEACVSRALKLSRFYLTHNGGYAAKYPDGRLYECCFAIEVVDRRKIRDFSMIRVCACLCLDQGRNEVGTHPRPLQRYGCGLVQRIPLNAPEPLSRTQKRLNTSPFRLGVDHGQTGNWNFPVAGF